MIRIALILTLGIMGHVLGAGGPGDPVKLISSKDSELQALLRKSGKSQKRTQRMKELINGIFDFQELGKKSLGRKTADSISEDQMKRFVSAFQDMVESTSIKKLEVYKADSTKYDEPEYKGKEKVKITAHTFFEGKESILEYKMLLKDGQWRAWDLVIDDLSTYRNYKEQFKRILKTKDIEGLIKILKDKVKEEEKPEKSVK